MWTALFLLRQSTFSQERTLLRVPQQYRTIQSAIVKARIGDTVLIDHGIYYENIRITKNIVVASMFIIDHDTAHIRQTIIDGGRAKDRRKGSVVVIAGPTDTSCVVMGFTIRNGIGTYLYLSKYPPSIRRLIGGGGLMVLNAGCRIAYNHVVHNGLSTYGFSDIAIGGGILSIDSTFAMHDPPSIIVEYNIISENIVTSEATRAGGMEIGQPGIVRHNVVTYNKALSRTRTAGGGIVLELNTRYTINLDANYVAHNVASVGGGIFVNDPFIRHGRGIISNNIIVFNEALEIGGGADLVEGAWAIFINNTIVNNTSHSRGGGIQAPHGSTLILVNNILWNNNVEQIASSEHVRALNNLIAGGQIGKSTIDADPMFILGDSLFRLSPESPCIGTGRTSFHIAGNEFPLPRIDYLDRWRSDSGGRNPDLGAIQSLYSSSPLARAASKVWEKEASHSLEMMIQIRQTSPPEYSPDSLQIVRGGFLSTSITVDDSIVHSFPGPASGLTFAFPPEENLLEIELTARGRKESKRLFTSLWLDGVDQRSNRLTNLQEYMYCRYANLRPGTYTLYVRPQDETEFIDPANQSAIQIVVLPYWYNRWWAYLLYMFGVIGIVYGLYRTRIKRMRLEQKLLS